MQPYIPLRVMHNYVYCPRLCYLQWVEKIFVENEDVVAGDNVHKRVDQATSVSSVQNILHEHGVWRSVWLESSRLGITGVIDYAASDEHGITLVDYKKGSPVPGDQGFLAKDNDALQLAAQSLLLAEHGLPVSQAYVYYAASRTRVPVVLDDALFAKMHRVLDSVRAMATSRTCPAPLVNDARCLYCSAYPVCLPAESAAWSRAASVEASSHLLVEQAHQLARTPIKRAPRPPCEPGSVLIAQTPRARVGIRGDRVIVSVETEQRGAVPIHQLRAVYVYGPAQVSTQAIHCFLENGISVAYFSPAGRFLGMLGGLPASGIDARLGQYDIFRCRDKALQLAKTVVYAKIHNQRVMLMRNGKAEQDTIREMARLRDRVEQVQDFEQLLGHEGAAAHLYFRNFGTMLKERVSFHCEGRNKRPPLDPVNALLSWAYSTLVKEFTGVIHSVGLDPYLGFMHQPRYGRPALALDLMEEFRPLIADSTVITMINRQEVVENDFNQTTRGVILKESARRAFWQAYFRRMDTEVSHPEFGYRMTYRRMLEVQSRQMWRYVRGEAPIYIPFTTR